MTNEIRRSFKRASAFAALAVLTIAGAVTVDSSRSSLGKGDIVSEHVKAGPAAKIDLASSPSRSTFKLWRQTTANCR